MTGNDRKAVAILGLILSSILVATMIARAQDIPFHRCDSGTTEPYNWCVDADGRLKLVSTFAATVTADGTQQPPQDATWWILMHELADQIPRAVGPYPSAEVCRLAGKALIPEDRQFWTAEEKKVVSLADEAAKAEAAKRQKTRQAEREKLLKDGIARLKGKDGYVSVPNDNGCGIENVWIRDGKPTAEGTMDLVWCESDDPITEFKPISPPRVALTGCVRIQPTP